MIRLIESKPIVGYLFTGAGFISGILTLIHLLTPIIGFGAAVFGLVAGYYHFKNQRREWQTGKRVPVTHKEKRKPKRFYLL